MKYDKVRKDLKQINEATKESVEFVNRIKKLQRSIQLRDIPEKLICFLQNLNMDEYDIMNPENLEKARPQVQPLLYVSKREGKREKILKTMVMKQTDDEEVTTDHFSHERVQGSFRPPPGLESFPFRLA